MADQTPPPPQTAETVPYVPHVGETRQYWRDIILGVNDGLVSIFLLVAGVVGGGLDANKVLLAAVAGSIAGAISMAASAKLFDWGERVIESEGFGAENGKRLRCPHDRRNRDRHHGNALAVAQFLGGDRLGQIGRAHV